MGNIGIINGINLPARAFEEFDGEPCALEKVSALMTALPEVGKVWILTGPEENRLASWEDRGFYIKRQEAWGEQDFFRFLSETSGEVRDVFYAYGDCPLVDFSLSTRMYDDHRRYFAQYTFADGYPLGMAPEILGVSILSSLAKLAGDENRPLARQSVFQVVSRDINNFDLETIISPRDMRMLRVSLTADTKRNFLLVQRIKERGGTDESSILKVLAESPEILRTLPAFGEFQITNGFLQSPTYLPDYPGQTLDRERMEFLSGEDLTLMASRFAEFAGDGVINLGFRGEPSLHPQIMDLAARVLAFPKLRVLLETSGLGWTREHFSAAGDLDWSRIDWILTLDAVDPDVYRDLRGAGMEEAVGTAQTLFAEFPGRVWVQATRLKETEPALEAFYRHWKEKTSQVIIQKYDDYCGVLPPRKVTDLAPLNRFPCWHIKRDLPVLMDGRVLLCREDLSNTKVMGNLLEEPLEVIWKRSEPVYREHLRRSYPFICEKCDEYYTFNY